MVVTPVVIKKIHLSCSAVPKNEKKWLPPPLLLLFLDDQWTYKRRPITTAWRESTFFSFLLLLPWSMVEIGHRWKKMYQACRGRKLPPSVPISEPKRPFSAFFKLFRTLTDSFALRDETMWYQTHGSLITFNKGYFRTPQDKIRRKVWGCWTV